MRESVQNLLRAICDFPLRPFEIAERDSRLRGAHHDRKAQFGRFERRGDNVALHLNQLGLRHFCFGLDLKLPFASFCAAVIFWRRFL